MTVTSAWWWPAPRAGEQVPDYPSVELTVDSEEGIRLPANLLEVGSVVRISSAGGIADRDDESGRAA